MDWESLRVSLELSVSTMLLLLPCGLFCGRSLAYLQFYGKSIAHALLAVPPVLPPTMLGYYLLVVALVIINK
ncbi:MAG: hypothetical protein ACU83V_01370 [Gammaproteobacteria bacterium]